MASSPDDLLSFKEFTPVHGGSTARQGTAEISVNSPQKTSGGADPLQDLIDDMTVSAKTLKEQEMPSNSEETKPPGYSFLTIEYYQQFFNVDTLMVVDRIASSMIPKRAPTNYLKSHIGLNPDLYGPFWIMVTLVKSL